MRLNSIEQCTGKCYIGITFEDEFEERKCLETIIGFFKKKLPVNCEITDLDTGYSTYENIFKPTCNYYLYDRLTTVSIFAFHLDDVQIGEVISNWGYYSIDALFALGCCDSENLIKIKSDTEKELSSMPLVIKQVLDTSIDIVVECTLETQLMHLLRELT